MSENATFQITEREAVFIKRVVKLNMREFKKDYEVKSRMDVDDFREELDADCEYIFKSITKCGRDDRGTITISFMITYDFKEDEINMEGLNPEIEIRYKHFKICTYAVGDNYNEYWIDDLVKTYEICKCGQDLSVEDGYCQSCYCYVIKREEDCCCCLENDGVWIETKCGHFIHQYCFRKIVPRYINSKSVRNCPLCREPLCDGDVFTV